MVKWKSHADQLAAQVTHPVSRWRPAVGAVPRHLFVPRWWERSGPAAFGVSAWTLRDGRADTEAWIRATYADRSLVTRVGMLHADHATLDDQPTGLATARSTEPAVMVRMLRLTRLTDDGNVLAVGASSGYACAVLCERSGHRQVSCLEPDEYLAKSAIDRLAGIGLHPRVMHGDLAGPLPGRYDRIVSGLAIGAIPAGWLAALNPGGRLVAPIAGTTLILTAEATPDGGAVGHAESRAGRADPGRARPGVPGRLAAAVHRPPRRRRRAGQRGPLPGGRRSAGPGAVFGPGPDRAWCRARLRQRARRRPDRVDGPPGRVVGPGHRAR